MSSSEPKKKFFWSNSPILSKGSITFKIYLDSYYQRELEEVQILCEWSQRPMFKNCQCLSQSLALHQNGVEFCQLFNGAIRISLSAPYDNVWRRMRLRLNVPFGDSQDIISFHCFIVT